MDMKKKAQNMRQNSAQLDTILELGVPPSPAVLRWIGDFKNANDTAASYLEAMVEHNEARDARKEGVALEVDMGDPGVRRASLELLSSIRGLDESFIQLPLSLRAMTARLMSHVWGTAASIEQALETTRDGKKAHAEHSEGVSGPTGTGRPRG